MIDDRHITEWNELMKKVVEKVKDACEAES